MKIFDRRFLLNGNINVECGMSLNKVYQFTHFPCDDWENIHFVLISSSNRKYELLSIV